MHVYVRTYAHMYVCTRVCMDGCMTGWVAAAGWLGGWVDGWADSNAPMKTRQGRQMAGDATGIDAGQQRQIAATASVVDGIACMYRTLTPLLSVSS